jgi:DNA-binding IclR family transcriptional regulator
VPAPPKTRRYSNRPAAAKAPTADVTSAGSFNRAVLLLRCVGQEAHRGVSLKDIVARTGLPRPTIHRTLQALIGFSWIERDASNQYFLGRDLVSLGLAAMTRYPIGRFADPVLARLALEIDQTVYLTLRVGDDSVCVARHEPKNRIQTLVLRIGNREPLGLGAGGMAMLASLPKLEADRTIAINMPRYRKRKGFDGRAFLNAYELTKTRGYAIHDGLFREGISGIGVAIKDTATYPVAGISTAFMSNWLDRNERDNCASLLQEAAASLSKKLFLMEK